jgi:hypothetical protein
MTISELSIPNKFLRRATRFSSSDKAISFWDQLVTSGSNALFAVLAAQRLGLRGFGEFAIAQTLFYVVVGLTRSAAGEAALVTFAGLGASDRRIHASNVVWLSLSTAVFSSVVIAGGLHIGFDTGLLPIAVAVAIPGMILQETTRWNCFINGIPGRALANDLLWAAVMILPFVVPSTLTFSASGLVAWWGLSGALVGTSVLVQGRQLRMPAVLATTFAIIRRPSWEFIAFSFMTTSIYHLSFLLLGVFGGEVEIGRARGAQLLFSPLGTLFGGVGISALTMLSRPSLAFDRRNRILWQLTVAGVILVLAWWAAVRVLLFLPVKLLGDVQGGIGNLIPVVVVMQLAQATLLAPTLALKADGAIAKLRRLRTYTAVLTAALGAAGAITKSATLTLAGLTTGLVVSSIFAWPLLRNSDRHGRWNAHFDHDTVGSSHDDIQ